MYGFVSINCSVLFLIVWLCASEYLLTSVAGISSVDGSSASINALTESTEVTGVVDDFTVSVGAACMCTESMEVTSVVDGSIDGA